MFISVDIVMPSGDFCPVIKVPAFLSLLSQHRDKVRVSHLGIKNIVIVIVIVIREAFLAKSWSNIFYNEVSKIIH